MAQHPPKTTTTTRVNHKIAGPPPALLLQSHGTCLSKPFLLVLMWLSVMFKNSVVGSFRLFSLSSGTKRKADAARIRTPTLPTRAAAGITSPTYQTPSPANKATTTPVGTASHSKKVQFGQTSAAEYERDGPSGQLTPLPKEVAEERFPVTERQQTSPERKETEETKQNSAILAEWEQDFDSYLGSSDDDDETEEEEDLELMLFSRKRSRRESSIFCPAGRKGALLLPDADETTEQRDDSVAVSNTLATLAVDSPPPMQRTPQREGDMANSDATPPSDVHLHRVNSSGGALTEKESEQINMQVRPIQGALDKCVEDEVR